MLPLCECDTRFVPPRFTVCNRIGTEGVEKKDLVTSFFSTSHVITRARRAFISRALEFPDRSYKSLATLGNSSSVFATAWMAPMLTLKDVTKYEAQKLVKKRKILPGTVVGEARQEQQKKETPAARKDKGKNKVVPSAGAKGKSAEIGGVSECTNKYIPLPVHIPYLKTRRPLSEAGSFLTPILAGSDQLSNELREPMSPEEFDELFLQKLDSVRIHNRVLEEA